ncbi:MAG: carboxypeptidase regulatory-like domain-containing protein [Bacteroidia bacterium]|nr:carboxypeptidase regulatory-like domain-containing protein [Bacteroidia bacterium]
MKHLLSLLALIVFFPAFLMSQTWTVTICGQVTDQTSGNPVAGQAVTINVPTLQGGGAVYSYNNTVYTDPSGNYCDTLVIPAGITQGTATVSTIGCNSVYSISIGFFNAPSGNNFGNANLQICTNGGGGGNCVASFSYGSSFVGYTFTNNSTGSTSCFWDFGDGSTSTSCNPTHAYSSPGTYTVCLIIQCASGADTTCTSITYGGGGGGSSAITGMVLIPNTGQGTPATLAEVFLIVYDTANGGTLTAVDTTTVSPQGTFVFSNVANGDYLVKAALLPSSSYYAGYLPTYFGNSLFWSGATTISVTANMSYSASILLSAGNNPGGPGFVGGLVSQGANKTHGVGDPLDHVQVMVLDLTDAPVQYTYTNANGEFNFTNLAYGTYKIYIEEFGKVTTPYLVTLSAQNPGVTDLMFHVHSGSVALGANTLLHQTDRAIRVFPNPVKEAVYVGFELENAGEVSVQIMDLQGKILSTETGVFGPGKQQITLDCQSISAGVYFVKFIHEDQIQISKLLKQ